MARRAFIPTIPPPGAPSAPRVSGPSASSSFGEARRSVPPGALVPTDGIPLPAAAALLDRLTAADDPSFVATWIESVMAGRARIEPPLAVRLLHAYRECGRTDRARDLAASLPAVPVNWNPVDAARLAIERAFGAIADGRNDHADNEIRQATRQLASAPKGSGLREQLDVQLAAAQFQLKLGRVADAMSAMRLAEHVAERIDEGPWRAPVAMTIGHLAMKLCDPRTAAKHYEMAVARTSWRSIAAMTAQANSAIALASIGLTDDARQAATQATAIAREVAAGLRQADAYDVLAIVEISADAPHAALLALDEALIVLGDFDQQHLRFQIACHRSWALAMLGRADAAAQWIEETEKLHTLLSSLDATDEQELASARARSLEASGRLEDALAIATPRSEILPDSFVTGVINLTIGRAALALGDSVRARRAVERAALSGDKHGWFFPEREHSAALWNLARESGDSRIVRYAERILAPDSPASTSPVPPSRSSVAPRQSGSMIPLADRDAESSRVDRPSQAEPLIYVTTTTGVLRVAIGDLPRHLIGIPLVVDTLTHSLKVHDREVSLERRRALEPLLVQLLRRAREGLSAEEILRAAGGPGPESADAEHRVRVLISRVRDLLGEPSAIERVRDAGEHGRTRYRIAPALTFALVEPLFSSNS